METKNGVAIFLPAWNEAANLPFVVDEAVSYLKSRKEPFTVIVVDDGSTDNTEEVIQQLATTHAGCIQHVRHERNLGYGAALRTGFNEGLKTNFSWIGFCDADGQFKPKEMEKLLTSATESDSDVAIGYRITRPDPMIRCMLGHAWRWLSSFVLGYRAKDVDCGFKLFRRAALATISPELSGDHATISPELLARVQRAGHKIVEVGVENYPRRHGEPSGAQFHVIWGSLTSLVVTRHALSHRLKTKEAMA